MNEEGLKRELERVVCLEGDISITFSLNYPISINRWLVTSNVYDRNRELMSDIKSLYNREIVSNDDLNDNIKYENKWRFYVSDEKTSFYKRNSVESLFINRSVGREQEKYIYLLCCLYSEEEKDLLVHSATMLPMPLRMWINGTIVLAESIENFTKNHLFLYRFSKGINTILVEKPMCLWNRRLCLTPKFFSLSICSLEAVLNNRLASEIDELSLLEQYFLEYDISINKLIYGVDEKIQLFVTNNKRTNENITVEIENPQKNIATIQAQTNQLLEYKIQEKIKGIVKVKVGLQYKYIMVGEYEENIEMIKQRLYSLNYTTIIDELVFNTCILNFKTGLVKNSLEPIHTYYSQPVLERLFMIEKIISGTGISYDNVDGFKIINSPIDKGYIVYHLQLPLNYKEQKKYPLIICLNFDDNLTHIPVNPFRTIHKKSQDYIIVTLCGQSEFSHDYLFQYDLQHAINYISRLYHVDQGRIYLYGICTGAKLGYNLIKDNMFGFAAFFSFLGICNEINTEHKEVPIIQICHVDDMFYNGATIMQDEEQIDKVFTLSGFEHEEVIDLYCNKNIFDLLNFFKVKKSEHKEMSIRGIRSVYTKQCYVIQSKDTKTELMNKVLAYVKIPLKVRARNYIFPLINEMELWEGDKVKENIIYIVKRGEAKIQAEKIITLYESVERRSNLISDNSFHISCETNPYNENSKILFIIYNSEQALSSLCDLWSQFDVNNLFNEKVISYDDGKFNTIIQ